LSKWFYVQYTFSSFMNVCNVHVSNGKKEHGQRFLIWEKSVYKKVTMLKKVEYKNNMHTKSLQKYCACKKVTNLGKVYSVAV